jgi:hypothetical protein
MLLQRIAPGTADVPWSCEEVIQAQEVTANVEAACAAVVCATEASSSEATMMQ